ncbi:hypothetical protein CEXT_785491 [Caerostris extrusa]|uniref:Uncharacterized protein n=1 Tax=Caerostris extrusa TaxID=172846 RepID=A0AAV4W505_CAEEX|nr:hypothetical protein CEXT_785491 [Caerostris extrusa]
MRSLLIQSTRVPGCSITAVLMSSSTCDVTGLCLLQLHLSVTSSLADILNHDIMYRTPFQTLVHGMDSSCIENHESQPLFWFFTTDAH